MADGHKAPRYAPGHELTVHPEDPVRGAELLREDAPGEQAAHDEIAEAEREGRKPPIPRPENIYF